MAITLEDNYLDDLRTIVKRHIDVRAWRPVIFGSRASGKARQFSDIDLGFIGDVPIPSRTTARLWTALDDSDIPYVVDIVDLSSVPQGFRKMADEHMEPLL